MNKNLTKRISALFIALAIILTMVPALPAKAGFSAKKMPKSETVVLQVAKADGYTSEETIYGFKSKVTSIKSSNKKVASVEKFDKKTVYVNPKKAGKATITVKCGKKKYTCKLKVINYKNPFKSIKLLDTNATKKFNKYTSFQYNIDTKSSVGKISVSLNSGFSKLNLKLNGKTVKNNAKIDLKGDTGNLNISVYNKTSKKTEYFWVQIYPPYDDWDVDLD